MTELFSQLDPTFTAAVLGAVVHLIAKHTQDSHGQTRPFVVVLCVLLGFAVAGLYYLFGQETVLNAFWEFIKVSGIALTVASTLWVFLLKPSELKKKLK